jgi:hypothetical protein
MISVLVGKGDSLLFIGDWQWAQYCVGSGVHSYGMQIDI